MCKIAMIPYIKPGKEALALKISETLAPLMTANDKDGFGYMALGDNGLFGERWLDVRHAFKQSATLSPIERIIAQGYQSMLEYTDNYSQFGTKTARIKSISLHARMATCDISLKNVHPFISQDGDYGIIHNGVITNHYQFKKLLGSTCDSESILTVLQNNDVANSFKMLNNVALALDGWYAVAAYVKDKSGNWYLDIFKEWNSNLFAMYIEELESLVFCTSDAMLKAMVATLNLTAGHLFKVNENMAARHDLQNEGKIVQVLDLDVLDYDYGHSWADYRGGVQSKSKTLTVNGREYAAGDYVKLKDGTWVRSEYAAEYAEELAADDMPDYEDSYDYINMSAIRAAKGRK